MWYFDYHAYGFKGFIRMFINGDGISFLFEHSIQNNDENTNLKMGVLVYLYVYNKE